MCNDDCPCSGSVTIHYQSLFCKMLLIWEGPRQGQVYKRGLKPLYQPVTGFQGAARFIIPQMSGLHRSPNAAAPWWGAGHPKPLHPLKSALMEPSPLVGCGDSPNLL